MFILCLLVQLYQGIVGCVAIQSLVVGTCRRRWLDLDSTIVDLCSIVVDVVERQPLVNGMNFPPKVGPAALRTLVVARGLSGLRGLAESWRQDFP